MTTFDIIVIGGGHAGVEAACVAERMGARVALVTMDPHQIGAMSCNPAIGGLGKGHLVREIDAFDGVLARAADAAAIHYRMLNRSKGSAVWGPRIQADRSLFRAAVQNAVAAHAGCTIVRGEAAALLVTNGRVRGVALADGSTLDAPVVILCTGTFLGGTLFRGEERLTGGRTGEGAASRLGEQMRELDLPMGRLKTGTPPRLDGRTIDWARLAEQPSDGEDWTFSDLTPRRVNPELFCAVTRTTREGHDIIRANLDRSPLFSGAIDAGGPRYCPSIEDKIHRFGDRDGHQVFLEPEGLNTPLVYPNGISTSLPVDVQLAFLRRMDGLERVDMVAPGYAVGYDYIDPRALDRGLALAAIHGVYCAGQINGTTGYEEAGAQGLVAGIHAACAVLGREAPQLDRANSYIAVMIDDLTLQGVTEPYRMLTARAEYRLRLRANNAASRLTEEAVKIGAVGDQRRFWFERRRIEKFHVEQSLSAIAAPQDLRQIGFSARDDAGRQSLREWMRYPEIDPEAIADHWHIDTNNVPGLWDEIVEDARYAPYLSRQEAELRDLRANESVILGDDFAFSEIPGLSNEMKERLAAARPGTLAAAARIGGITPAALAAVLVYARKRDRKAA